MTLLATLEHVEQRLGRPLRDSETNSAKGLLQEATIEVRTHLGWLPDDGESEAGEVAILVISRVVKRSLERSAALSGDLAVASTVQETAGPFSRSLTFANPDVRLLPTDKNPLAPYRRRGGLGSIQISSGRTKRYRHSHTW